MTVSWTLSFNRHSSLYMWYLTPRLGRSRHEGEEFDMKVRKAELISITMLLRYPETRPFAFASYAVLRLLNRLLQHVWAMTELFLPNLHVHVFNANVRKLSIFTLVSFLTFMLTTNMSLL